MSIQWPPMGWSIPVTNKKFNTSSIPPASFLNTSTSNPVPLGDSVKFGALGDSSDRTAQQIRADQVVWGDQIYVDRVGEFRQVTGIADKNEQGRILIAYALKTEDPRTISGNIAAYPDNVLTVIRA